MENVEYCKLLENLKERQFYFLTGGRNDGKIEFCARFFCCQLEYYLGGKASYTVYKDYVEINIHNDDIDYMKYTLLNDTIYCELGHVIITRMLEEYDAYMRYKYRDYRKENEE